MKSTTVIDLAQAVTRPLVTFMFTAAICYGFVAGLVGAETFTTLVSVVITFWFAQRGQEKTSDSTTITATAPSGGSAAASVTPPTTTTP